MFDFYKAEVLGIVSGNGVNWNVLPASSHKVTPMKLFCRLFKCTLVGFEFSVGVGAPNTALKN